MSKLLDESGTSSNNKEAVCGVFGRNDAIKHVNTPMINWHGPTGTIFTADLQPTKPSCSVQRLATGGADSNVQIWELKDRLIDGISEVEHLCELKRHDSAVNVVRFHPSDDILASASDDRCLFIWKLDNSTSDIPNIFDDENDSQQGRENWIVLKQIRGHGSEVYDISWSPDAKFILSGTMDNAAYVWNVETCRKVALLQHHKNYIQGVAWDPNNQYVVTQSSDRTAIVYSVKKFDPVTKLVKMKNRDKQSHDKTDKTDKTSEEKNKTSIRLFLESGMVDTFFRRPDFSPDGKLLVFPTGCYEVSNDQDEDPTLINVVHVFQHKNLESPVCCLPTGKSPAIAVRFCPQRFNLRVNKDTNQAPFFSLPYRMIFAVITLDYVLLYDTQQRTPFASINSIHYEQLTDASWSSNGRYLVVTSVDGFLTIVTFDLNQLGSPYKECELMDTDEPTKLDLIS